MIFSQQEFATFKTVIVEFILQKPTKDPDYFYRNAYGHEYIFIHRGKGKFVSDYGVIHFEDGDQLFIPQSTTFQMFFEDYNDVKIMVVESSTPYEFPKHYRNPAGQFEEHAPFCERDFKLPESLEVHDEKGDFKLLIKAKTKLYEYIFT